MTTLDKLLSFLDENEVEYHLYQHRTIDGKIIRIDLHIEAEQKDFTPQDFYDTRRD